MNNGQGKLTNFAIVPLSHCEYCTYLVLSSSAGDSGGGVLVADVGLDPVLTGIGDTVIASSIVLLPEKT